MKNLVLILVLFSLSACKAGDVLSSHAASTSETHNQPNFDGDDDVDVDCKRVCTLECLPDGRFAFQLLCVADDSEKEEILASGTGPLGGLPEECRERQVPECE